MFVDEKIMTNNNLILKAKIELARLEQYIDLNTFDFNFLLNLK